MIYDCFTFFNELDLLEIRLNTLAPVVDKFVIAESTRTHRGKPKPLLFESNKSRFSAFLPKIIYIKVEDLLPEEEINKNPYERAWINENRQRNALKRGLVNAAPNDIFLLSDLDEIPHPEVVKALDSILCEGIRGVRFRMSAYYYYLNYFNYTKPIWEMGTFAARFSVFEDKEYLSCAVMGRFTPESENQGATMQRCRFLLADKSLPRAGWHFSYLGGIEAIENKLKSFSHSEFSTIPRPVLEQRIRKGRDPFGRGERFFGEPIDDTFPRYIKENQEKLAPLIFKVEGEYLKRTALPRRIAKLRGHFHNFLVRVIPHKWVPRILHIRESLLKKLGRL